MSDDAAIDGLAASHRIRGVHTTDDAQLVLVPLDLRATSKAFGEAVPPLWRHLVRPARLAVAARGAWADAAI